ncbi:M20 family metallopeptidase [Bacillus solimangrovi]|uniref:Peptidase M20 n=1 Tax=Bacillus solimangrovi TaxID=1305675 RepID=A0A1E5LEB3_9BACI|nr:M20 family metallopeptidase [Bacillus solimangrovi]OEH92428.1 peptidase M20 [Bacillus solimangrovi]
MLQTLFQRLEDQFEDMIRVRRYLHMHPEVSFKEEKTAKYIANFYTNLDMKVRTNVGGNGIVSTLIGGKPGKTIALRADFDALPIQDEKDVAYKSTVPGVMHACGHDGHTSMLLHLAKALHSMRDKLYGTYVFIHQHAEEYAPGGAKPMIEDGCLNDVDMIFGTHFWVTEPLGTIGYRTGPIMAAADRFKIEIQGKGGHGAQPHHTKDAVVTASQLVCNLQQIVSRRVNPLDSAVLSIGNFEARNEFNIIADTATLSGTVRTFKEDVRNLVELEMARIIKGTCLSAGITYNFQYDRGYPPVVNHELETTFLTTIASDIPDVSSVNEIEPQMAGEDFAYYLQHVPGTFFFTGAAIGDPNNMFPHHHPKFDFDERAMFIAAQTLGAAALKAQTR